MQCIQLNTAVKDYNYISVLRTCSSFNYTSYTLIHRPNNKLYALYSSPNIIRVTKLRRLKWAGHLAHVGDSRGAYRVLVRKPEGRRRLGRPRHRWEDNIEMHLREVGWGSMGWINLA
jgi:hypothetical protein